MRFLFGRRLTAVYAHWVYYLPCVCTKAYDALVYRETEILSESEREQTHIKWSNERTSSQSCWQEHPTAYLKKMFDAFTRHRMCHATTNDEQDKIVERTLNRKSLIIWMTNSIIPMYTSVCVCVSAVRKFTIFIHIVALFIYLFFFFRFIFVTHAVPFMRYFYFAFFSSNSRTPSKSWLQNWLCATWYFNISILCKYFCSATFFTCSFLCIQRHTHAS